MVFPFILGGDFHSTVSIFESGLVHLVFSDIVSHLIGWKDASKIVAE